MVAGVGELVEIRLDGEAVAGRIRCPLSLVPAPGQYVMARALPDADVPLAGWLYLADLRPEGFLTAPGLPAGWLPGTQLSIRGPLGKGFQLPPGASRVALAGLDEAPARLRPLARQLVDRGAAVTLYCDHPQPDWPVEVEIAPLSMLPEALAWADYLAVDALPHQLDHLRDRLKLVPHSRLPCPGQVLVAAPLPCAGTGECGVCAVRTRRGWKLACKDGPVFDLDALGE